jgi:hypothetical protein
LEKAGNDGEAMAAELTLAGFEVSKHRDLTFRKTVLAFEEFYDKVKGGDEVVVFYAGHGVQTERGSYLLPTDIEGETTSQIEKISYSVNNLLEELDRLKARFSLIIIDACRDNPLRSRGRTIGVARGLNAPDLAKGQMVIFSAGRGQKALDSLSDRDKNPNGVFTRELISRIRTPGQNVEKLAIEVKSAVERLALTVKHEQRPLIVNDSTGEFYFFPAAGSQTAETPSTSTAAAPLSDADREDRFWQDAKAPDNLEGFQAYLSLYPAGRYAGLARANVSRLSARAGAVPAGAGVVQVASQTRSQGGAADPLPNGTLVTPAPGAAAPEPKFEPKLEPKVEPKLEPKLEPAVVPPAVVAPPAEAAPAPSLPARPAKAAPPTGPKGSANYTLTNGDRFEGEVIGSTRHGQGAYAFANGDKYQGGFIDGLFSGTGVMSFANGDKYEGTFVEGVFTNGTLSFANGDRYEGQVKGSTRQGKGVMQFANKDRYEGEFVDNLYHGKGEFRFASGESYVGEYRHGLKQGHGVYIFANRDRFEGEFDNDLPHGKGSTRSANGDYFEGLYVKGVRQGTGIYRFANGDQYEGNFTDGLFNGKGVLKLASGDRYEGEFKNNLKDGAGVHFFASKDRFEGQFRAGVQAGTGTHYFANGDHYVGEYANGLRHGKGVHTFASGQSRQMEYVQGVDKTP